MAVITFGPFYSGTVSSVSVVAANGVSAVITNPTTTPSFTFTLGDITPSSIVFDPAGPSVSDTVTGISGIDGNMFFNVPSGKNYNFHCDGTSLFSIESTGVDFNLLTITASNLTLNGGVTFGSTTTIVAGAYSIGRDASNRFVFNAPTAVPIIFSVNGVDRLSISSTALSFTQEASATGTPTILTIIGGAHTNRTASVDTPDIYLNLARTVQIATGSVSTQSVININSPTYSFVGASTISTATLVNLGSAPSAGTNATITTANALSVGGATAQVSASGFIYNAITVPNHTLTLTGSTSVTSRGPAGIAIGLLTITDSSAVTVATAASLYIAGAPNGAGSVTLTNTYSVWVDAGAVRFDEAHYMGTTVTSTSSYTVLATDYIILSTRSATGTQTVNLPVAAANAGRILTIKDAAGNAVANNITLDGNASETIDGATTYVMNANYQSVTLICNGTSWFVI